MKKITLVLLILAAVTGSSFAQRSWRNIPLLPYQVASDSGKFPMAHGDSTRRLSTNTWKRVAVSTW